MSILAGLAAANQARKWLPYAIGAAGGLILGLGLAVAAWLWQGKEIDSLTVQRDTHLARAQEQAAGLVEARRVVDGQRQQIDGLISLWRKTREEAERIAAETQARAKTIASLDRKLKELTDDPSADPADIAIYTLECLRQLEAGDPAAAGAC